jgi:hypothetical protein
MSSNTINRRLPVTIDSCAYATDPAIYIRNAWAEPVKPTATDPHRRYFGRSVKPLPVGDAIAFVFGDESLVCNLRTTSTSQQRIYTRKLPTELALQDDTSLDSCAQWRCIGQASDYFAFDKADPLLPWRWNFRAQDDAIVIMPTAQPLGAALGLQISQPFNGESWLELRPYCGSWADTTTYLDRHPPVYPQHPDDAWGWLLPTAPFNLEIEGYRFRSVWEYAVNPILRARDASNATLNMRLCLGMKQRVLIEKNLRKRIMSNIIAIESLSQQAPSKYLNYWKTLLEVSYDQFPSSVKI